METIARIDDAEQQRRLMDVILHDVKRIDRLITDISSASRLDAELSGELPAASNLSEMLSHWTEMLTQRYPQTGFDCLLEQRPLMVAMHNDRIIQVLDNLLSNTLPSRKPEPAC